MNLNTIYKGALLAIGQFAIFLSFFYTDLLSENRTLYFIINLVVGATILFLLLQEDFLNVANTSNKILLHVYLVLCLSSFFWATLDYGFNNYLEPDYKFIKEEKIIEAVNKRRDEKGVGMHESFDRDTVEQKYSIEGTAKRLVNSCALNIVWTIGIASVGILYRKIKDK